MAVIHDQRDRSGLYRVLVDEHRHAGFPTRYTVRVIDIARNDEMANPEEYHTDADALVEGWASVSLLMAAQLVGWQGAYVIGDSAY